MLLGGVEEVLDDELPVEGDVADGDLLVVSEDGDDGDGEEGEVDGDAEGVLSLERSPVRLLGDSVQAVARVKTRASIPQPLRNFFIADTSRIVSIRQRWDAIEMPRSPPAANPGMEGVRLSTRAV